MREEEGKGKKEEAGVVRASQGRGGGEEERRDGWKVEEEVAEEESFRQVTFHLVTYKSMKTRAGAPDIWFV